MDVAALHQSFVSPAKDADEAELLTRAKSWRWLGQLRRTLSTFSDDGEGSDSTADDEADASVHSLSEDDAAVLDAVFKSKGTAAEAERMRTILSELADGLESLRECFVRRDDSVEGAGAGVTIEEKKDDSSAPPPPDAERMSELLLEVRDLCSYRPDFARAFVALGGLAVLLGCAAERSAVPRSVRSNCFLLLSELTLRNVPIQIRMLEEDAVRKLAELYFAEFPRQHKGEFGEDEKEEEDVDGMLRGRIIQAIDAAVCEHASAERRFCSSERGRRVVEAGMGIVPSSDVGTLPPAALRGRCLSLLRELLQSPCAGSDRAAVFSVCLEHVATRMTVPETEPDESIRLMALGLILKMLRQKGRGALVIVKSVGGGLVKKGDCRLEEIRGVEATKRMAEGSDAEWDLWFGIVAELKRAQA